jgi:multiple sugar transport system ATP-binding protein
MVQVCFDRVSKLYADGTTAVDALDLDVADGEFLCVLGPSGCGKSSTIRMLAGLEDVSLGEIRIDGRRVNEVSPQRRDAAMVFENYALYPHLSSFDNIAMPLRARGAKPDEIARLVRDVAATLKIGELLQRRPAKLSGGQRQRVAIGRAIIRSPRLFLMDEPLGHLEAYLRVELRAEIRALQERLQVTTLYVTHDQEEAAAVADKVAIMAHGKLQQSGRFLDALERPANVFVASFIGEPPMNFFEIAALTETGIGFAGAEIAFGAPVMAMLGRATARPLTLGVRPQDFEICAVEDGDVRGQVLLVQPQGRNAIVFVEIGEATLVLQSSRRVGKGETLGVRLNRDKIHVFDATGLAVVHGTEAAHG